MRRRMRMGGMMGFSQVGDDVKPLKRGMRIA